jgi:hypothetical protein
MSECPDGKYYIEGKCVDTLTNWNADDLRKVNKFVKDERQRVCIVQTVYKDFLLGDITIFRSNSSKNGKAPPFLEKFLDEQGFKPVSKGSSDWIKKDKKANEDEYPRIRVDCSRVIWEKP